jgi:hypothetical protein
MVFLDNRVVCQAETDRNIWYSWIMGLCEGVSGMQGRDSVFNVLWQGPRLKIKDNSCQHLGYFKPRISIGFFPILIPNNRADLSKVANSNDKFRQTVGGDSEKRRLYGEEYSLCPFTNNVTSVGRRVSLQFINEELCCRATLRA